MSHDKTTTRDTELKIALLTEKVEKLEEIISRLEKENQDLKARMEEVERVTDHYKMS